MLIPLIVSALLMGQTFMDPESEQMDPETAQKEHFPRFTFGQGGTLSIRAYGALKGYTFPQTDKDSQERGWHSNAAFSIGKVSFRYKLGEDFTARMDAELGTDRLEPQELWFQYRALPSLFLRAGRFKSPFGLAQVEGYLERPFPDAPLISGNAKDFYDTGFMFIFRSSLATLYGAAVTGSRDVAPSSNEEPDAVGRLLVHPFKKGSTGTLGSLLRDFHVGVSGSTGRGPSRNGFRGRTPGDFTYTPPATIRGDHRRFGVEAQWKTPWFYVRGEYQHDEMARQGLASFDYEPYVVKGWYVETGIPVPGLSRRKNGLRGLEFMGRFEQISHGDGEKSTDISGIQTDIAPLTEIDVTALTLGLAWHVSANIRLYFMWQGMWFSDPRQAPDFVTPDDWTSSTAPVGWKPTTHGPVHHFFLWTTFRI
ncbi:OprO/OprP family phosphate-selective porin [Myxococcota bacterium]|nr:OprO/OprP family phosphate-selective porin [Myxococcota bacterium]MBU1535522.1 OprO/OprP family phosphate-selective porin [Myxococcota bacterium]